MAKKKAKKPSVFDAVAWALTATRRRPGPRCPLCQHTQAAETIRKIVELIDSGRSCATVASILGPLRTEYGIDVTRSVLAHHVREHVRRAAPK